MFDWWQVTLDGLWIVGVTVCLLGVSVLAAIGIGNAIRRFGSNHNDHG
jgi:hypothetical protein